MKISDKNNIFYLDEGRLEIYTPSNYDSINHNEGDAFKVFGLCPYKFYTNPKDTKPSKVGIINEPSMMTVYPVDMELKVEDDIWGKKFSYTNTNEYTVLHFASGRKLMDKNMIQNLDNVNLFMDLLLGAKLDNNIPYPYLSQAWMKNMAMNGQDLGAPITIIDLIIYELCRSITNKDKPFGAVYGKDPSVSPVAYRFANVREVCATNSVFTALAFEDMNSMLDSSLNMTQKEKDQKISPLEQIIKF